MAGDIVTTGKDIYVGVNEFNESYYHITFDEFFPDSMTVGYGIVFTDESLYDYYCPYYDVKSSRYYTPRMDDYTSYFSSEFQEAITDAIAEHGAENVLGFFLDTENSDWYFTYYGYDFEDRYLVSEVDSVKANVAHKVKSAYIGVETQVPIYDETTVPFGTASMDKFFTVSNNSAYPFTIANYSAGMVKFEPGNFGVKNSTSQIILTAVREVTVNRVYARWYTEASCDKLNLTIKGIRVLSDVSGENTINNATNVVLSPDDTIVMSYTKDGSNDHDSETLTNIIIGCKPITNEVITGYETKEVARKVKSAYIGVLTDNNVTELQGKEITLWRNYFTAENSSDYPVDWSGYTQGDDRYIQLKFGNYGVNSSTSHITLTSKYDLQNCKIEGQYHTEKNYDKITVKVNDETVLDAVSGESTFVDIWEGNLSKGDTLYFYYSKDGSNHATDENITLFEFRCDLIEEITEVVTQTKSGAPFRNLFFQEYTEEQVYKEYQTGSNGTNNWENNNAGEDHSPYRMLLSDYPNGDSSVDARRVIGPNGYTVHLEKGHKYYFSCYVYTDNVLSTFDLYWPILEPVAIRAAETVAKNNVRISAIFDRSRFSTGDYPVRFDCNNPSTSPMKITDITLVDLTATFGAGNEPNVTWCDANIPYHGGPQGVIPGIATARLCYNSDGTNFDKIQPVTVEEPGAPAEMEA